MRFLKNYILVFLMFASQFAIAQIEFKAEVSKNKLGVNQRFRIEFKINKQGADNFKAPDFSNFKIVGGPSSSVNQSWINGKSTYSQSYIYIIQPKTVGEFTIQPATIEYEGETIKSNLVKITVTKAIEIPKDPNNPEYIAQQNVHVVAEVSNLKPYVGEGIYVVYKMYISDKLSVYESRASEVPQYIGFWNQNIENSDNKFRKGSYKGDSNYYYAILNKAVLIPQKPGKHKISSLEVDFRLGVPTGRGDFFGNMIMSNITYSTESPTINVNVKELPQEGKPLDFNGAVGEFEFKVTANKNVLKANDAAQIKVEVSGRGNMKLFEIPKITTPPELEVYTPEHKEKVSTALNGMRGTITDTYTVVPQYKGKYKIPEVSFSYFNPKEGKYNTIKNQAIYVEVTEGKELPTDVVSSTDSTSSVTKKTVVGNNNNFRFIALNSLFETKQKIQFFKTNQFYLLLLLPFLVIPIGIFIGRKRAKRAGDVFGNRIRLADRLARKYLSQAKKQLGNHEAFYIALEKALHNFLKAKLKIETSDISKEKISEILQNKGVEAETIKEFVEVLNDCDFARYTPSTDVMMEKEFEKAKLVITKIDKHL